MAQEQDYRNHWESELNEGDLLWINEVGYPLLTSVEQEIFNKLEIWHQHFFKSLMVHTRIKTSLEKLANREKRAVLLFERHDFIKKADLSSVMKICDVATLLFPLIDYEPEKRGFEDDIIWLIEREGLTAGGATWENLTTNVFNDKELMYSLTKEGQDKKRNALRYAKVNIRQLESMEHEAAFHLSLSKSIRAWRYFLQDRAKASSVNRSVFENHQSATPPPELKPAQPPTTTCSPQAKQPQAIPQPREAKYSATENEDKRRREIYSEVVRTHAAGAKIEMLIEEAATKARCNKRTMRRAVFGK